MRDDGSCMDCDRNSSSRYGLLTAEAERWREGKEIVAIGVEDSPG